LVLVPVQGNNDDDEREKKSDDESEIVRDSMEGSVVLRMRRKCINSNRKERELAFDKSYS